MQRREGLDPQQSHTLGPGRNDLRTEKHLWIQPYSIAPYWREWTWQCVLKGYRASRVLGSDDSISCFFQLSQCAMCLDASHVGSIPFQSSLLIWVMVAPAFEGHCECCTVIQWYPVAEFLIMVGIQNRLMVLLFNRLILIELIDPVDFNSFGWNRIAIQKILADPFSFSKLPCYLGMSSSVLVAMEDDNCINISVYSQEW